MAASRATLTIPIVMVGPGDPLGLHFIASLAHPGGNITGFSTITPDLAGKLNGLPRGLVPRDCSRLTAFVDIQQEILFWTVCGWSDRFGGALVEYGTFPAQPIAVFTAANPPAKLSAAFPGREPRACIYAGLGELIPKIFANASSLLVHESLSAGQARGVSPSHNLCPTL